MRRYYITDRKSAGGFARLLEIVRVQMARGVDLIQIREKDASAREVWEFVRAVVDARSRDFGGGHGTKILVNSRSDIALAAGADGVHLPADAPDAVLGRMLVGRSCHTLDEIRRSTADFVTFGPVFGSPGKGAAVGLDALRDACKLGRPVFALGGITWENAESCREVGAEGIAGIRLFQEST